MSTTKGPYHRDVCYTDEKVQAAVNNLENQAVWRAHSSLFKGIPFASTIVLESVSLATAMERVISHAGLRNDKICQYLIVRYWCQLFRCWGYDNWFVGRQSTFCNCRGPDFPGTSPRTLQRSPHPASMGS